MITKGRLILFIAIFISAAPIKPLFAVFDEKAIMELEKQEKAGQQEPRPQTILRSNVEYKAEGLRDPFKSYLKEKKEEVKEVTKEQEVSLPLPTLIVQGIIWGGAQPQAIINNKVVKIGDVIEEARIIDISKEGVTVFFGNQKHLLQTTVSTKPEGGKNERYKDKWR